MIHHKLSLIEKDKLHTFEDIEHYKYILEHLESRWKDVTGEDEALLGSLDSIDAPLASQCRRLWNECFDLVKNMEQEALEMPEEVRKVHSQLVDIHRRLQEMIEGDSPKKSDVQNLIEEIDAIDAKRISGEGLFGGDIEAPAPGQAVCLELLDHCYEIARQAAYRSHDEPDVLINVTDSLRETRNELRKLKGMKHHTEADIAHYRFLLGAIASNEAEYPNEWKGSQAENLLVDCLNTLEELESTVEKMDPQVEKVYNELEAIRKQMSVAVSSSGPADEEKMKEWHSAIHAIDDNRIASHGVFAGIKGNLEAPAGQVACNRSLKQCYDLLHELSSRRH